MAINQQEASAFQKPLISIITPTYNAEKFIEPCILNFLQQDCLQAEQVIVDGLSNDRTIDIVEQYARQDTRIRWISEKDCGQADAMNKGIKLARGEIISFLNVDDFYSPGVINRILEIFSKTGNFDRKKPIFLVGNCNICDDKDRVSLVSKPMRMRYFDLLLGWEINPIPVNPSSYFYHKCIHELVGLYAVDEYYMLDWDFILRAVKVADVRYVDECWGNYRYIPGTKTFEDDQMGTATARREQFLEKHRHQLPILQRQQLRLMIPTYRLRQYWGTRLRYFYRHPIELPQSILKNLRRITQ